jgi:hypothetical protein
MLKPRYSIIRTSNEALLIRDQSNDSLAGTVTNCAEEVVAQLNGSGHLGKRRLFYYDTDDVLSELVHDGKGRFMSFSDSCPSEIREALVLG